MTSKRRISASGSSLWSSPDTKLSSKKIDTVPRQGRAKKVRSEPRLRPTSGLRNSRPWPENTAYTAADDRRQDRSAVGRQGLRCRRHSRRAGRSRIEAVVPARRNRKDPAPHDAEKYKGATSSSDCSTSSRTGGVSPPDVQDQRVIPRLRRHRSSQTVATLCPRSLSVPIARCSQSPSASEKAEMVSTSLTYSASSASGRAMLIAA